MDRVKKTHSPAWPGWLNVSILVLALLSLGFLHAAGAVTAPRTDASPIEIGTRLGSSNVKVIPGHFFTKLPTCDRSTKYLDRRAGKCRPYPTCKAGTFLSKRSHSCKASPQCGARQKLDASQRNCIVDPRYVRVRVPAEDVRFVNANIKNGMASWREDYNKILAVKPDFITLQEMPHRSDAELAVQNYAIYRSHDSAYTAETPVLWNTVRWSKVDAGTKYLTVRKVQWGVRAVNWVTVKSKTTGRKITIVSAHPAPTVKRTEGLLPIFVAGLLPLVEDLYQEGEVLVGGDFNAHYQGPLWDKSGLANSNLTPTFDKFGKVPTGNKYGATIDYMFSRTSATMTPTAQGKWNQNSDHNALWSEWTMASKSKLARYKVKSAVLAHAGPNIAWR